MILYLQLFLLSLFYKLKKYFGCLFEFWILEGACLFSKKLLKMLAPSSNNLGKCFITCHFFPSLFLLFIVIVAYHNQKAKGMLRIVKLTLMYVFLVSGEAYSLGTKGMLDRIKFITCLFHMSLVMEISFPLKFLHIS